MNLIRLKPAKGGGEIDLKHSFGGSAFLILLKKTFSSS
jgi:hypothetical protein